MVRFSSRMTTSLGLNLKINPQKVATKSHTILVTYKGSTFFFPLPHQTCKLELELKLCVAGHWWVRLSLDPKKFPNPETSAFRICFHIQSLNQEGGLNFTVSHTTYVTTHHHVHIIHQVLTTSSLPRTELPHNPIPIPGLMNSSILRYQCTSLPPNAHSTPP